MRYFRVNIPKRYRSEENAKHLMAVARQEQLQNPIDFPYILRIQTTLKILFFCRTIKLKRMRKYEKEYIALKEAERAREDPAVRAFA